MKGAAAEKSSGMKFAEQQLLRHGWEQGKGLGRGENGISEAIKVKVKCDKGGFGHKESEQFTFHWWDHVFNKASASLAVESGQNGVVVKKMEGKEEGAISNKKPRKAMMDKSALYGRFVKSATLLSGQEQPEHESSSSDDSSSEDDEKLDLSSAKKLSDAELMKACGGRTAHKGARHGFTMSAKLARLEQQEQEFMAKYGKKMLTDKTGQREPVPTEPALHQETVGNTTQKKAKKKKQHSHELENGAQEDLTITESLENHNNEQPSKKRKNQSKDKPGESLEAFEDINEVCQTETKKKRKRSEKKADERSMLDADSTETLQPQTKDGVSQKEKRRKKKRSEGRTVLEDGPNESTVQVSQESTDTTESPGQEQQVEGSAELQLPCDSVSKKKKKKKKSSKHDDSKFSMTEIDSQHGLDISSAEWSTEAENVERAAVVEYQKSKKRMRCNGVEPEADALDEPLEKKKKSKKHEK